MESKYYVEELIGHPLLIIWEYDERCLGPTNWSGGKCHKVSTTHSIHRTGIFTYIYHKNQLNVGKYTIHGSYGQYGDVDFTFFLSKLEVDALEKGRTWYPLAFLARQKKTIHFFGGVGTIGVDSIKVVAQLFRISLGNISVYTANWGNKFHLPPNGKQKQPLIDLGHVFYW